MTSSAGVGVSVAPADRGTAATTPPDTSIRRRVAVSIVAIPGIVLLAIVGGIPYLLFSLLVVGLGLQEFYRMLEAKGLSPHWKSGLFATLVLPFAAYVRFRTGRFEEWHFAGLITVLLGAVLLAELRRGAGKQAVANSAATLLGVWYIGWFGSHIGMLRELPFAVTEPYARGVSYALLPFALAWTADTAAYAVGRAAGRHKLMPEVSPHKSVEGGLAGLIGGIIAAWVARATFANYLTWGDALALGVLVGVFGQLGDLVESLLKRDADRKDSSQLIPGHGGVLDRFDSILFAAPIVYYYLLFRVVTP